jgi:hypothetical protein
VLDRADLVREVFGLDGWYWLPAAQELLGPPAQDEHYALVSLGQLEVKRRDDGLDPDEWEEGRFWFSSLGG